MSYNNSEAAEAKSKEMEDQGQLFESVSTCPVVYLLPQWQWQSLCKKSNRQPVRMGNGNGNESKNGNWELGTGNWA